ncbi:MAG: hypothetical protein J6L24_07380 [Oscillospiraceae bacterium]|nr:hypothetical protein [Oscillospiraceae bacterium]
MKCNKKTVNHIIIMLLIWSFVALSLILTDHFFLRNFDPDGDGYAQYRLIPPSIGTVKSKIHNGMPVEEVYGIMGYPNTLDPYTSMDYRIWDLQLGCQTEIGFYSGKVCAIQGSFPFTSSRWLIFPGIMLAVAGIEVLVYVQLRKRHSK